MPSARSMGQDLLVGAAVPTAALALIRLVRVYEVSPFYGLLGLP